MSNGLTSLENKLIVPEGKLVAVVNSQIAHALHKAWRRESTGPNIKDDAQYGGHRSEKTQGPDGSYIKQVGRTFMGLYGSIGEVNLIMPHTSVPALVGVVYIPQTVFPFIELMRDEAAARQFYSSFFRQTEGTEWRGREWNIKDQKATIDPTNVDGLPFIAQRGYNWKVEKVYSPIFEDDRALEEQVADYELAVESFISRLDAYIHGLNPMSASLPITSEYARNHFKQLETGTVKLLGN